MPARSKEFNCAGVNCSVTLHDEGMTLATRRWGKSRSHELPLKRIESVIVQRKSVVPFAVLAVISGIVAFVAQFNLVWFLFPLDPPFNSVVSIPAFIAAVFSAISAVSRALFVNVRISWDGKPKSFLVRFVLARSGVRLARRFQRMTVRN